MSDNKFGERLHALRTGAGISQERLAQRAGISVRALSDMERGRTRGPRQRTVEALVAALGVDGVVGRELEDAARSGRPRAVGGTGPRSSAGTGPGAGLAAGHGLALPRDLCDFTARGPALAGLRVLAEHLDPARPPVAVICGQPGLGKTAFAVHAAHALAPSFPDGQYAVDLRGMDPKPTPPREVLARLLYALGVAETAVPAATDERSGLLRSVLRERRVLLLLDNAADEDQVRPLLPGHGACLTLVTSRRSLAGLEAVHRTELALLRREEAVELLTRVIGSERVEREKQAARDLAELCGYLPLAMRIAAQRLASRPGETLAKLVTQLTTHGDRLDTLQAGSLQIRSAFTLSYRQLSPAARTVFRRASLACGPDFSPTTAALLADIPPRQAARCLERLTDAGLLQPHSTADRYRFHDLLRLFAAEQLTEDDDPIQIADAQDRAAHWILRRATAAALRFDADHHQDAPEGDPDLATAPTDREQARIWLEAERPQWLAALGHAQAAGRHQQVIDAAEAMHWFSDVTAHWELWAEVFQRAADSARALGSRRDEAVHLNYLAWACNFCLHDYPAALAAAQAALAAAYEAADQLQAGWALGYEAGALRRLGRTDESIVRLHEAATHLRNHTDAQVRLAELTILNTLGQHLRYANRPDEALVIHRRSEALCLAGVPGVPHDIVASYVAQTRHNLGSDLMALGQWGQAESPLRAALAYWEAGRMPAWSEPVRLDLGITLRHLNRHHEARATLTTAHRTLVGLNNPRRREAADELCQVTAGFGIAGQSTG
ncbi:helix-turn-helix domain-containing protein [Streptomyces sp. NBC_01336]|uniref:ATP-binding protein n=1 Tax=Streptomyces sp. NBC_01336 TaxID=2903829 RepID=UPI002E0E7B54|nr:helix-turn-helix domain-containing protein [Streptomyces sp. NBC_01336]